MTMIYIHYYLFMEVIVDPLPEYDKIIGTEIKDIKIMYDPTFKSENGIIYNLLKKIKNNIKNKKI